MTLSCKLDTADLRPKKTTTDKEQIDKCGFRTPYVSFVASDSGVLRTLLFSGYPP
jgi:hypothetical protein